MSHPDTNRLLNDHRRDQRRRGLAETSIRKRHQLLTRFAWWLEGRSLLVASTRDVEGFLDGCDIAARARYAYLSNLHTFYAWAIYAGHTQTDPTAPIRRPKLRAGLPRPIADADLEVAMSMAPTAIRVMLSLAAYEGMRVGEIARCDWEDVLADRRPPVVIVHGKGGKERPVPLHPETLRALGLLPGRRTGPVIHRDGTRLTPVQASQVGNDYLHGCGITATMHQLRHWFGTTLYETSGRDLLLVRDLMGHSSILTTTGYAAYDRRGAATAVEGLGARLRHPSAQPAPASDAKRPPAEAGGPPWYS